MIFAIFPFVDCPNIFISSSLLVISFFSIQASKQASKQPCRLEPIVRETITRRPVEPTRRPVAPIIGSHGMATTATTTSTRIQHKDMISLTTLHVWIFLCQIPTRMVVTTIPMTMVARTTIAARAIRATRAVEDRLANPTAAKSKTP